MLTMLATILQFALFSVSWFAILSGFAGILLCVTYSIFVSEVLMFCACWTVLGFALRNLSGITLQVNNYDTLLRRYRISGMLSESTIKIFRICLFVLLVLTFILFFTPLYTEDESVYIKSASNPAIASYAVEPRPSKERTKLKADILQNIDSDSVEEVVDEYKKSASSTVEYTVLLWFGIANIGFCDRMLVRNNKFKIYKDLLKEFKYGNISTS